MNLKLFPVWQKLQTLDSKGWFKIYLVGFYVPKRRVELNNAIRLVIVKKRFGDEKIPLTMCNHPGANREVFSHIIYTDQLQRIGVVDMHEMFARPFRFATTDRGENLVLNKNDASVVKF